MWYYINFIRIFIAWTIINHSKNKDIVYMDIQRWIEKLNISSTINIRAVGYLLIKTKEYRNLLLVRIEKRISRKVVAVLFKPLDSLYINTKEIGGGLFIQHGFATIIAAESIGSNCTITQQVTIGYSDKGKPTIGNGVKVTAGAKIIGPICIGDGAVIGANAVVTHNIPANAVAVGVPARVIKYLK